jgi:hypothetical protein
MKDEHPSFIPAHEWVRRVEESLGYTREKASEAMDRLNRNEGTFDDFALWLAIHASVRTPPIVKDETTSSAFLRGQVSGYASALEALKRVKQ